MVFLLFVRVLQCFTQEHAIVLIVFRKIHILEPDRPEIPLEFLLPGFRRPVPKKQTVIQQISLYGPNPRPLFVPG